MAFIGLSHLGLDLGSVQIILEPLKLVQPTLVSLIVVIHISFTYLAQIIQTFEWVYLSRSLGGLLNTPMLGLVKHTHTTHFIFKFYLCMFVWI